MLPLPGWSTMTAAIAALTQSLARPIVRGMLPYRQAQDAVAMAILKEQSIPDAAEALPIWLHVLGLYVHNAAAGRDLAYGAVKQTVQTLIDRRQPSNRLYAEAHNANEDHHLILTEDEVDDIVSVEMTWAVRRETKRS